MLPPMNIGRRPRLFMTADTVGGVWQYATDLARALSDRADVTLCVLGPPADVDAVADLRSVRGLTILNSGLPLDWTGSSEKGLINAAVRIAEAAEGFDIVHLNVPALAALACYPAPVVAVVHSCVRTWWAAMRGEMPLPDDFAWRSGLTAEGLAAANIVVAPSSSFAAALQIAYRLEFPPHVIHNGRDSAVAEESQAHPPSYVIAAGRLWDESKGAVLLDQIAARLSLPLVAAGPLRGPNGTRFTPRFLQAIGRISDREVRRLMGGAAAFVSTARYEPFGLAVLEAAQAGLPLVLSDIPTFRELWNEAAIFVPASDADVFADALEQFTADEDFRAHWSGLSRERAARFTSERMAGSYLELYQALLSKTSPQEHAA